jgi:hypothetical protein
MVCFIAENTRDPNARVQRIKTATIWDQQTRVTVQRMVLLLKKEEGLLVKMNLLVEVADQCRKPSGFLGESWFA